MDDKERCRVLDDIVKTTDAKTMAMMKDIVDTYGRIGMDAREILAAQLLSMTTTYAGLCLSMLNVTTPPIPEQKEVIVNAIGGVLAHLPVDIVRDGLKVSMVYRGRNEEAREAKKEGKFRW